MLTLAGLGGCAMDALNDLGIPNALCGGLALNSWTGPEGTFATVDVDVAILAASRDDVDTAAIASALSHATGQPCVFRDRYRRVDRTLFKFGCGEGEETLWIDLVLAEPKYAAQAIEAAAVVDMDGRDGKILQPEDVILYKALARRPKDVEKIQKLHEIVELDLAYIEAWAKHLDRWEYVHKALASGGPDEAPGK